MAHLSIALLGPFQATLDGQPITTFKSDKARALLAYLAVEAARPHARDTLAALLWPDWPEAYARSSLRSALANLRQAIHDSDAVSPHLLITRETIQFNRESDHVLDAAPLLEGCAAPSLGPSDLERLRQGIALYRGDFLEGFSVPDSAAFEEWAAQERESLRQQARSVLHRLAGHDLERGDYAGAESNARRCLGLEPWDEEAHRHLMRALALEGDRSAALAQYEACRVALAEGLGVEPEPETTRLYQSIRTGLERPSPGGAVWAVPDSLVGGRYAVVKLLGEGAKKRAYQAHDTLLDREVAVALLKTEGLDESARARLRREAQAMARLGSHAHLVTIHDLGEEAGQPFIVTEYMAGGSVEELLAQAPEHRLPLELAREITTQVCRGLQFAHAQGIVHRDLKPGNVWLTAAGTAKIGDFGLALPLDAPRLTREGMMVGMVSYMSPEQATGDAVTSRADLYALGCMLYEMVTGRPPFLGDDPVAIVSQQVHTPPVAPIWHNPHCPRDLEALILRLLAKDPAQRPADAGEVLTALEGVDLGEAAKPTEPQSLDSLAGGVFVGRQREMGELKAALEEALSGHGRLVVLVGEPGIGKTRTALELSTYAGLRRAQVLWGRCHESPGAPPYWPWVQAIRAYVREREPQVLRVEMGSGAAEIAQIVSEVRQRLPDVPPPPTIDDPESARFRLFDAVTTFLKSASQAQPLVLILDDLHWADKPSLLLLQFLAGELAASRLLVVGCYRDVELSRKHPLAQALGGLMREQGFQRVLLRGLTQDDVGRFIELTAGIAPPPPLVHAVYTQTEGNPLFINEVVRLLVQEGQLSPEKLMERTSWTVRIPEGVREVIGRRLDRLSERCNQVLTLASVIGREFTLAQLRILVEDLSEDRLLEVLEEGLAGRAIEELPRAVGRYQFTHGLIQETLAQELSATRRVRLHARIAQGLEALYGAEAGAHAAELAYHYGEAETVLGKERLAHYSLLAGEKARASYAWEEAVARLERGLAAKEGQPMDDDTAGLLFGLGEACIRLPPDSQRQDTLIIGYLRCAFDYYQRTGNGPLAAAMIDQNLPWVVTPAESVEMAQRALQLVPPDSRDAGHILTLYAIRDYDWSGDYETARGALDRALEIAQHEKDANLEMSALERASQITGEHLKGREVVDLACRALSLAAVARRPFTTINAHRHIAEQLLQDGDLAGARQHVEEVMRLSEHLRDNVEWARSTQARFACARGDMEAARTLCAPRPQLLYDWVLALLEANVSGPAAARPHLEIWAAFLTEQGLGRKVALSMAPFVEAIAVVAWMTGLGDILDFARTSAQKMLAEPNIHPLETVSLRIALGLIATGRGDIQEMQTHYQALLPHAGMASPGSSILLDRVRGLLAGTMGEPGRAAEHFEDALAFARKGGYRPELAWTCHDYADLLLKRNAPGDTAKAATLLDEALALAQQMGMRPLVERVQARRK